MASLLGYVRTLRDEERFSAFSGCVWALIAYFLGYHAFGNSIWGGLIAAPLIGILIGRLARHGSRKPRWVQVFVALLNLYIAVSYLALVMAFSQLPRELFYARLPGVLAKYVFATLVGITFSGYVFILWPLAYFNHRLLWPNETGTVVLPPQIPVTSSAIKAAALTIIGLSVVAYFLYGVIQWLTMTVTEMPWWVLTDVMGWSNWAVLGGLVWLTAPIMSFAAIKAASSKLAITRTYGDLLGLVGFVIFTLPPYFVASTLIVAVIKITLVQSWATEGTVFAESYYYLGLLMFYAPYLGLGCGLMLLRRLR